MLGTHLNQIIYTMIGYKYMRDLVQVCMSLFN